MNNKVPTLRALAQQLNIHSSTVSRVLKGDEAVAAKAASQETIERIRALAAVSGYIHNPHAISLRTKQSHLIGVSVPRLADLIWATVYEGIEETASSNGYYTYVTNSYDQPAIQSRQLALSKARRVDGLILGDARMTQESLDYLHSISVPFVLAFRKAGNFLSVVCDDYYGGQLAAKHLLERGHREVGILGGLHFAHNCVARTEGFMDVYREAGYPVPTERIVWDSLDTEGGREGAQRLIAENPAMTAIFTVNDFAAIGAMGAMREAGHTPGATMALIGYNDTPLAPALPIPLTTLRNPLREVGKRSMDLLLRLIRGEHCESVVMQPELIVRESSNFTARRLF